MVDVSSALCFMHNDAGERTAHGDVKLENILLFGDGHAKLCDLGAAESEDVSSTRGVMSMQYVSPERIEDAQGRASGSADVWALGIVLHFLLFGKSPFRSAHAAGLVREIVSFQPTQIGTSCGEKERELLIRILDPDCVTRLTSKQLAESSILRCLINTTWEGWKLSEIKARDFEKRFGDLQDTLRTLGAKVAELTTDKGTLQDRLNEELAARLNDQNALRASDAKVAELTQSMNVLQNRLKEEQMARLKDQDTLRTSEVKVTELLNQLMEEQAARRNDQIAQQQTQMQLSEEQTTRQNERERNTELQNELKKVQKEKEEAERERNELKRKMEEIEGMMRAGQPKAKDGKDEETKGAGRWFETFLPRRTDMQENRSRKGADAIEWFPADGHSLSGSVFTRTDGHNPTLLSFSFGNVVARFSFTIRQVTLSNRIGIVASSQTEEVQLGRYFTSMLGGAGWNVFENCRDAHQFWKDYSRGSACAAGREGQQVVLEADGRDGKRTLRLSQDGRTQPTFFSHIPVPFRFALLLYANGDSVSIESVEVLTEPTLTGGTTEIRMAD
ncbi:putative Protein kinase domain containing protein [Blattamonas nauphoetae]|uniref:Protein kinase domain-containing protein n=1 Tax=Blattamonas nauphoetae TaxID=2049346 RepID=A0ABQ9Y7D1_9EUKA|nr:putative Protein kinase domain containing protein [Blattamonas nauphoetae]